MRIKLIFMSFFLLHAAVSVVHAKELKSFHEKLMAAKSFGECLGVVYDEYIVQNIQNQFDFENNPSWLNEEKRLKSFRELKKDEQDRELERLNRQISTVAQIAFAFRHCEKFHSNS